MILEEVEAAAPRAEQPKLEPTPEALKRFLGHYCAEPGIDVNIEYRGGRLRFAGHGGSAYSLHAPAELEPTDREDEWLVREGRAAGERAVFTFGEDGRVLGYELGAFVFRKYEIADR